MPARIACGSELDGFRIGQRLHAGAMGDIFHVDRGDAPFPMIMKVPRLGNDQTLEGLLAFETEVMILPVLQGTHFPRFVKAGDITANPYLVLEWLDGESLAHVAKHESMTPSRVAGIGAGIADALHSLHQQDTIHLDIKPDNVVLRPDGAVCLIDFGLAHHAKYPDLLAEEKRFTAGSAPYVSPEQIGGTRSNPQSDLFALGVVLFEISTGKLPFGIPESMAGLGDRLWHDPIPPRLLKPDMPAWLQEIILRCIEPDATRRYQSAAHVAFDLRNPDQVQLTERAAKTRRDGLFAQARRWWQTKKPVLEAFHVQPYAKDKAPVILAAIDTTHLDDERHPALRSAISKILQLSMEFRLICVSVIRGGPDAVVRDAEGVAVNTQMDHMVRLRNWVDPLHLSAFRLSLHVLEAANPADALVDFARRNNVDLIVIGAPAPDQQVMAWWRSVASSVTANAHCSVHVVRVAQALDRT